jgi:hypothetical protein
VLHADNPTVISTLVLVGLVGILILGAHQVDEAGHRRAGLAMMIAALFGLVAAVFGLAETLLLLMLATVYGVFIGLPVLALVLLYRRLRRRAT